MTQEGITGKFLIKKLNLFDDDILGIVQQGLQPYGKYWKPILPPGSEVHLSKISVLMRQQFIIENRFPGIRSTSYNYDDWYDLYVNGEIDAKGKLKNIKNPDGTNSRIRARYETIMAQIDKLSKKCSWGNYVLPKKNEEIAAVKDILLIARYKIEDILELDVQLTDSKKVENRDNDNQTELTEQDISLSDSPVDNKPKVEVEDPEAFIRSVQVTYVSETKIKIKVGKQKSNLFHQKEVGFIKSNSKIWQDFIAILKRSDHAYYVGKARGAHKIRKSSYDLAQKRLSGISEKFVSFLNTTYQAHLLKNFKVYELMPEKKEEPGKYRFKFKVCDPSTDVKDVDCYDELSKTKLISEIEMLSSNLGKLSNYGDKDTEIKVEKIYSQLYQACEVAGKKGWLGRNQIQGYLKPVPESIFPRFGDVNETYNPDLND